MKIYLGVGGWKNSSMQDIQRGRLFLGSQHALKQIITVK